tara:strand:- start:114 stop:389 length:276 start_codon:yes stop_codon:yes gene_type:complete
MSLREKYPENCPWDSTSKENKSWRFSKLDDPSQKLWTLSKHGEVFTFKKSKLDSNFVYIQKNSGKSKAINDVEARFTFQRLFDQGYDLDCA